MIVYRDSAGHILEIKLTSDNQILIAIEGDGDYDYISFDVKSKEEINSIIRVLNQLKKEGFK